MGDSMMETAEKAVKIVVVAAVGAGALALGYAGVKHALKDSDKPAEPLKESVSAKVDALAFGRHAENKLRVKFDKSEDEEKKDLKEVLAIRAKMASDVGVTQVTTP